MNKKDITTIITLSIASVCYSVVVFVACGFADHGAAFWLSYAFMAVSILMVMLTWKMIGNTGRLLGYTFLVYTALYLGIEFVLSTLFIVLDCCTDFANWQIAFAPQFVLLGAHILINVLCNSAKDEMQSVTSNIQVSTECIKALRLKVSLLPQICKTEQGKIILEKLSEDFRYSDPVSKVQLVEIESRLSASVEMVESLLNAGDEELAIEQANQVSRLLAERNRMCKLLK